MSAQGSYVQNLSGELGSTHQPIVVNLGDQVLTDMFITINPKKKQYQFNYFIWCVLSDSH